MSDFSEPLPWPHYFSGKLLTQPTDGQPCPALWLAVFINRQEFFVINTLISYMSAGIIYLGVKAGGGGSVVCVCVCSPCLLYSQVGTLSLNHSSLFFLRS